MCLCSSNSYFSSIDHRGCSTKQIIQDTNGFSSAWGIPVIAPAFFFTSFSLISYGGKEDKKYCR